LVTASSSGCYCASGLTPSQAAGHLTPTSLKTNFSRLTDCWIAAGPCHHSDSWFRIPRDSWPYFTLWRLWQPKSKLHYDRRSIGQSWCQARIWGTRLDFCYCQTVAGLLAEAPLTLASSVILGFESCWTHDHSILSQVRDSSNLDDQVPVFIFPRHSVSFPSPLATRRVKVEIFNPVSSWGLTQTHSQSHIATDGQSVIKSWHRASSGAHDQIFITVWQLRSCFCGAPSLTRGQVCLLYVYAAGPCQRSLSRVLVPWDLRPYLTVSDMRLPFSSPPTTRRVTVEVFDPAFTRVSNPAGFHYIASARTAQKTPLPTFTPLLHVTQLFLWVQISYFEKICHNNESCCLIILTQFTLVAIGEETWGGGRNAVLDAVAKREIPTLTENWTVVVRLLA
jgi:hypothetical protein